MVAKFKDYRKLVGELLIGLVQKVKSYNRYIVRIFKTYLVGGAVTLFLNLTPHFFTMQA